jgi:hypothetical protein
MYRKGLKKKVTTNQNYEKYWRLTVEYSNIIGEQFVNTLSIIVRFIDEKKLTDKSQCTQELYQELQRRVEKVYPKRDSASTRKSINQFVKLGFVSSFLIGYNDRVKEFLHADDEAKKAIFAELFYKNSAFNSSVKEDHSKNNHMKFFIKTLTKRESAKISQAEFIGIIKTDISKYSRGYLTDQEIVSQSKFTEALDELIEKLS